MALRVRIQGPNAKEKRSDLPALPWRRASFTRFPVVCGVSSVSSRGAGEGFAPAL